jgi:hypothetical protein
METALVAYYIDSTSSALAMPMMAAQETREHEPRTHLHICPSSRHSKLVRQKQLQAHVRQAYTEEPITSTYNCLMALMLWLNLVI